jgi:hypothetical protein
LLVGVCFGGAIVIVPQKQRFGVIVITRQFGPEASVQSSDPPLRSVATGNQPFGSAMFQSVTALVVLH